MAEILLYDLPSKNHCACWSYNPWKARMLLNLKSFPYKTQWIEYPDIAPTFKALGIPPNAEGTPYTIPTIRIGEDRHIMDSRKIAAELDRLHPEPPIRLDSPALPKVEKILTNAIGPLRGVVMPKIPRNLLNPPSVEYFEKTREVRFGMPLAQLEKEAGGDDAWEKAAPAFKEMGALLREEKGPFIHGTSVSYADIVIVTALHFMKRIDENIYERAVAIEPALKEVYDASKQWLVRDDH